MGRAVTAASCIFICVMCAAAATEPRKVVTIQAEVRTARWLGWSGGEPAPESHRVEHRPEKFTRFPTPAGEPQTFSGRVIGIPQGKSAQAGVVALRGTHWASSANYKWTKCEGDGSFSVTGDHFPGARKAIVAAVDGSPWTFLRAEFLANQSARDIELRASPGKTIVLTMEDHQGRAVQGLRAEIFNAYERLDDEGNKLQMQRFGMPASSRGAIVFAAPLEPIAVLVASNRLAPYYAIIDPREADEFHFKMLAEGRLRGVVTQNGQPAAGAQIYVYNPAAPLSATARKTDAQGRFDFVERTPGVQEISVGSYHTSVSVDPGETADVTIEIGGAASATPLVPVVPATTSRATTEAR